ncbi:uncharacterized protein DUF1624 [Mucilaginibacter yixingensis]|uniref:Uncharacterized protein DUF1624 n=1 Tax=Mucilaginibacter yixingensis TaxID=1295612 RepID=A0A2T5J7R8_9SPHI|nr:hypothetical protein [Mucilaginibacter yixingensis]PTQ95510.1 uncharacterized protein DUF1624 [Mucilaginibacter yixingensis]
MGLITAKRQPRVLVLNLIVLAALSFGFYRLKRMDLTDRSVGLFWGLDLILLSLGMTILLFYLVTVIFGFTTFKKGVLNFLIGDSGTYSLSRLQAVAWAVLIMSCQIALIICLCCNKDLTFKMYEPLFSESEIWLLGLSLGSTIAVKSITVKNGDVNPNVPATGVVRPSLKDILNGENGLDFTRCQMLIWTLLAMVVFLSKAFYFNQAVFVHHKDGIDDLLNHFYNEYNGQVRPHAELPYVPYLPWSFVVLMGMSQGVYVGKKLVPSFKLADVRTDKQQQLVFQKDQLEKKRTILTGIMKVTQPGKDSVVDQRSVAAINQDINDTQSLIDDLTGDINQINAYIS